MKGEPIDVYNNGEMKRDFTYIDDIIESVFRLIPLVPDPEPNYDGNPSVSFAPFKLYNIGNNSPVQLLEYIKCIELALDKKAKIIFLPIQSGDVPQTYADVSELTKMINFNPATNISDGINNFIKWYKIYNKTAKQN
jgi:UDP-glucuronate 4-epimerase